MSEKRKSYDKEFKLSVVKMILEGGMSVSRVSKDLGVNENSLHNLEESITGRSAECIPGKRENETRGMKCLPNILFHPHIEQSHQVYIL